MDPTEGYWVVFITDKMMLIESSKVISIHGTEITLWEAEKIAEKLESEGKDCIHICSVPYFKKMFGYDPRKLGNSPDTQIGETRERFIAKEE